MNFEPRSGGATRKKKGIRPALLKQLHMWHWMSSAVALAGLILFTVTGFTLNHAAEIEGTPVVSERSAQLPASLLPAIAAAADASDEKKPLPAPVADWVGAQLSLRTDGVAEWSASEIYLALPRPGGDGWVTIDRATGAVTTEKTDRGWISYLNDLHKGRNTGTAWKWFIDIFALASLVFAITGLVLLWLHAAKRRSTWPIVGFGMLIPVILAMFFIH